VGLSPRVVRAARARPEGLRGARRRLRPRVVLLEYLGPVHPSEPDPHAAGTPSARPRAPGLPVMPEIDALSLADQAVMLGLVTRAAAREAIRDAQDGTLDALAPSFLPNGLLP